MIKRLILLITCSFIIFVGWCNNLWTINKKINIKSPIKEILLKSWTYSLNCKSNYYSSIIINDKDESYINVSEWHDFFELSINWGNAIFNDSEYKVIQDDSKYLILTNHSSYNWKIENIFLQKSSWIGYYTKTNEFILSNSPISDTYILSCTEI